MAQDFRYYIYWHCANVVVFCSLAKFGGHLIRIQVMMMVGVVQWMASRVRRAVI